MRRRALLMGGNQKPLIIEIDTRNISTGSSGANTFTIPVGGLAYYYRVDWGDGTVTNAHTGNASHTYSNGGVYEIKITGKFPKFNFNNTGDRLKVLRVLSWGNLKYSTNQSNAFYGCGNLTEIAEDEKGWYNSIIIGTNAFRDCNFSYLPSNMTLASLTNGTYMFYGNSLTSLPSGMVLDNLTTGTNMFNGNSLTSLPSGMTLASLTIGTNMFMDNSLTSLPSGMVLDNLTTGTNMFYGNSLTSLPSGMTLASLTNGVYMFAYNNNLTSLPDGMTLENLTSAEGMFRGVNLTSLPDGMTLANLTNGFNMFLGNTINTVRYSQLLIDLEALNPNNDVIFSAGNSKYNSSAVTARATLTDAPRNWTITDGGLE